MKYLKLILILHLAVTLSGCLNFDSGGGSSSPQPTNPNNQPSTDLSYQGQYSYPELSVGEGAKEVAPDATLSCKDSNGRVADNSNCPLSAAPKILKSSPAGTHDVGSILGSLGGQRLIQVEAGELLSDALKLRFKCSLWRGYVKNQEGDFCIDSFNYGPDRTASIRTAAFQEDGKVIVGGWFESIHGAPYSRIARLNTDGSVDRTFNVGSGFNDDVTRVAYKKINGKAVIYAVGTFSSYNGVPVNKVVAINEDGSLNQDFSPHTVVDSLAYINAIAIQSDGKILLGGSYNVHKVTPANFVVRLNPDGTSDSAFNQRYGGLFNGLDEAGKVYAIALQTVDAEERIVIGGYFEKDSVSSVPLKHIKRLKSDGSIDAQFNPGQGFDNIVYAIAVQKDGKIVVGGSFSYIDTHNKNYLARLELNGGFDPTFNYDSYLGQLYGFYTITGGNVRGLSIQDDGKILVAGSFDAYNNPASIDNGLIRINTDGSKDESFNTDIGFSNSRRSLGVISRGSGENLTAIYFGDFSNYRGSIRLHIVALKNDAGEW